MAQGGLKKNRRANSHSLLRSRRKTILSLRMALPFSRSALLEPAYMELKPYLEPGDGRVEAFDLTHGIALPGPANGLLVVCLQGRLTMIEIFEPPT